MVSNMNNKDRFLFNIIYLAIAILWPLIQTLYLGGLDGVGRVQILLMTLAVFVNFNKLLKSPKQMLIWILWIAYVVICSQYKGFYHYNKTFWNWTLTNLLFPYVTMLIAYQAIVFDYSKTVSVLFGCYLLYVLLGTFSMQSIESYDIGIRLENDLGNTFFNTSILFATFAALLYSQGRLRKIIYWLLLLLVFYIIYRSGERKGLICVFIIIFGTLYAVNSGKGAKSLTYMGILFLLACGVIAVIMEHSVAGQRLTNSMTESQFQDSLFLKLMGDRGIMYYLGWDMFLDNFWTGIGITNFSWQNGYHEGLPFHTEYMVQLAECGIIGTLIFIVFYYGMLKRLLICYRKKLARKEVIILMATFVAFVVINLVAWTYTNANYFMMYGIIYGATESLLAYDGGDNKSQLKLIG